MRRAVLYIPAAFTKLGSFKFGTIEYLLSIGEETALIQRAEQFRIEVSVFFEGNGMGGKGRERERERERTLRVVR